MWVEAVAFFAPAFLESPLLQVFPLPIEGFETRVVADDEQVIQYMIELSELLEQVRTRHFFRSPPLCPP